ncbi:MAG: hypothetical protein AB8G18_07350 [Gammaproteobacteria bacterium]
MNLLRNQLQARRHFSCLVIFFVGACGGGGGGSGTTTIAPPAPPPPSSVTFEADLIAVKVNDLVTGDPVSVDGLPIGSALITVTP